MNFSKNIAVQRLVLPEVKDIKIFGNIKKIRKSKLAFTLAETLIVVSMLGVVAAITLPSMYSKHTERVNIVKIKKAMAIYDSALRRMKAEHSLNTETAFNNWINENANCANPSNYFVKSDGNGCIFRTQDGLWWNITNINNPLVAFERENLTEEIAGNFKDYRAFMFLNKFDDKKRFRTNDLGYEKSNETIDEINKLVKIQNFINGNAEEKMTYYSLWLEKYGTPCNGVLNSCIQHDGENQCDYVYDKNGTFVGVVNPSRTALKYVQFDGDNVNVYDENDNKTVYEDHYNDWDGQSGTTINRQGCIYSDCLLKGTLITMADGTQKSIEYIQNGDLVLSVNPSTWELEPTPVIACDSDMVKFANESDKWYFEDGTVIETAHRHRFYNLESNTVKYMDEWIIGEHACKIDGTNPKLVKHEKIEGDCQHYTLFTANQTYFANGLISGNRHTLAFGKERAIKQTTVA